MLYFCCLTIASCNTIHYLQDTGLIQCAQCKSDDLSRSGSELVCCIHCKKLIHNVQQCSIRIGEESFLCVKCYDINELAEEEQAANESQRTFEEESSNVNSSSALSDCQEAPEVIAARQEDQWGPKRRKMKPRSLSKRMSLYINNDKTVVRDLLQWRRVKGLPILLNASTTSLGPSKIQGRDVSLRQTCAFDSLFQLFLALANDNEFFREIVSFIFYNNLLEQLFFILYYCLTLYMFCSQIYSFRLQHLFFAMLCEILDRKSNNLNTTSKPKAINKGTYTQRAQILAEYMKFDPSLHQESSLKLPTLDCNTDVTELAEFLFGGLPSVVQTPTCQCVDQSPMESIIVPQITLDQLTSSMFREDYSTLIFDREICTNCNAMPEFKLLSGKNNII